MSPAYVRLIFFISVLRVEDQDIGALKEFDQFGPIFMRPLLRLLRT